MLRAKEIARLFDRFFVPEARRKLAGGEGVAATTGTEHQQIRVPAGTPDKSRIKVGFYRPDLSGAPPERNHLLSAFRWLRFAAPPANIQRASGAQSLSKSIARVSR